MLAIVEAGGYPDLSPTYVACGFEPTIVYSDRKAFALCRKIKPQEINRLAARWEPWRTVATWYLWRGVDPDPIVY